MKKHAKGTLLKLGDGAATEAFTTIAQLTNIGGVNVSKDLPESTTHDEAAGDGYKTFLAGFKDGGEVPIEGLFDPTHATHDETTGLISKFESDDPNNFRIELPQFSNWAIQFSAHLQNLQTADAPTDDGLKFSGSLKITGKPDWNAAAV